jgi:hypothetical protein
VGEAGTRLVEARVDGPNGLGTTDGSIASVVVSASVVSAPASVLKLLASFGAMAAGLPER